MLDAQGVILHSAGTDPLVVHRPENCTASASGAGKDANPEFKVYRGNVPLGFFPTFPGIPARVRWGLDAAWEAIEAFGADGANQTERR